MINCTCDRPLIADVGEGFIVTLEDERRWMRRRTDVVGCPDCGSVYRLLDLVSLRTKRGSEGVHREDSAPGT